MLLLASRPLGHGKGWAGGGRVTRMAALALVLALVGVSWRERTAPLRALGAALVHEDLVEPADVAVVSMSAPRAAALDAAKLYRRGLVRAVWLPRWPDEAADRRVDALGAPAPRHHDVAGAILLRAGVPPAAIHRLAQSVTGLEGEMATVGRALRKQPTLRAIVLTLRSHTARARLLLHEAYAPATRVQIRAPHADAFATASWWRERSAVREVLLESLKWAALLVRGPEVR